MIINPPKHGLQNLFKPQRAGQTSNIHQYSQYNIYLSYYLYWFWSHGPSRPSHPVPSKNPLGHPDSALFAMKLQGESGQSTNRRRFEVHTSRTSAGFSGVDSWIHPVMISYGFACHAQLPIYESLAQSSPSGEKNPRMRMFDGAKVQRMQNRMVATRDNEAHGRLPSKASPQKVWYPRPTHHISSHGSGWHGRRQKTLFAVPRLRSPGV